MRSLCFTKIGNPETGELGELALLDLPKPVPGPQDVLIKLAYGGICGSDTHTLTGHVGALRELMMQMMPMPEGHEFSGIIEEVGEYAGQIGYKPGDRVVANYVKPCGSCYFCRTHRENFCQHPVNIVGGCADYICVNVSQVYKIPDSLSLKVAALTEPFTIAFNAVKMAKVHPGSRVAVFGGGAIGQMAAQAAKLAGAAYVTMFEPVKEKRELAISLGTDNAFDSVTENVAEIAAKVTGGLEYDCVIEASGNPHAATDALNILSPDGDIVYFSMYPPTYEMPLNLLNELYSKQKHLHGMQTSAGIWQQAISVMPRLQLEPLIQKMYPLEEYEAAFSDHLSKQYAKVMFCCDPELN